MAEIWAWIKENPKASALIAVLAVSLTIQAGIPRNMVGGGITSTAFNGVSTTAKTDNHLEVVIGATKDCPEVKVVHDCKDQVTQYVTQYVTVTAKCPTVPAFRLSIGASMPVYPIVSVTETELEALATYHKVNIGCGVNTGGQIRARASYQLIEF